MRAPHARALFVAFFALYTVALTYPGIQVANRVAPLVLGLPFFLVWIAGWIALGGIVLWIVWRAERRSEEEV